MALTLTEQIKTAIDSAKNILVVFRNDPLGDGAAGACALAEVLEKLGKQVEVVGSGELGQAPGLNFLSYAPKIKSRLDQANKLIINVDLAESEVGGLSYELKNGQLFIYITARGAPLTRRQVRAAAGQWPYDLIFVLDCPDLESLGDFYDLRRDLFSKALIINIDHHAANENFGQINLVDLKAAATCEIIFDLLSFLCQDKITGECGTALLCGLLSKTRNFKAPGVSAQTLSKASELLALGARREEIVKHLFANRSVATLKLWGLALARLKSQPEFGLVSLALRAEDFLQTGTAERDLLGMIEELISQSPAAKIVAVFYESSRGGGEHIIKALVHTHDHYDAKILTKAFAPSGSRNLARFNLTNISLAVAESQVTGSVRNILQTLYF